MSPEGKALSEQQAADLLQTLEKRFEQNKQRHPNTEWKEVQSKLEAAPQKLWSLAQMEQTGGEPDVVELEATGVTFCDCSPESPAGRRNLCYDQAALEGRKKFPPQGSALQMAQTLGITLLEQGQYRSLQRLGKFDQKTSSWIVTPPEIRRRGGALFCDRRYEQVFVYHNGAESYYAARGFRGWFTI